MILVFYTVIVFIATTLGASAGIGGGIIIKPAFDLLNQDKVNIISFLSANAVFFMALYSSIKRIKGGNEKFNKKILTIIALSSIVGGYLGNKVFYVLYEYVNADTLKVIQSCSLCLVVTFLIFFFLFYKRIRSFELKSRALIFFVGMLLGFISSFLSIGGGPLNVALYYLFFGFSLKVAVAYSIATILFAQGSQLINIVLTQDLSEYPWSYLLFIVPVAIFGGVVGQYIYKRISDKTISFILSVTMFVVLCINLINIYISLG